MGKKLKLGMLAAAAAVGLYVANVAPLTAQELRVATSYKLLTLDPHYAVLNENIALLSHIYERLLYQDEALNLKPGLATSWKRLSETQWEFKLRENVRFQDGSAFGAEDVIYTIKRIQGFLKPPSGGFQAYVKSIKSVVVSGPSTVVIETEGSVPTLPLQLSNIFIMHHEAQGFRTTEEFNSTASANGTGPYKFDSWQSGETLKLIRNEDYWGGKPAWADVTFRIIESPAARVAALVAQDVDLADFIPARDVEGVKKRGLKVESVSAARSNFLQFDLGREELPGVTDKDGNPIPNPFRDVRVRRALAMATDRAFLADKILLGYGSAAAQFFPNGLPGTSPKLVPEPPDYERAKALLAEAGFPNGFNLSLAGSSGRYPGDGETLQAIAQNWARAGVGVKPIAVPFSVFETNRAGGKYAVWYAGCSGEAVDICLNAVVASPDKTRGTGALNYGNYRNQAFDDVLAKARTIEVGPERNAAIAQAAELVMADQPVIPLYHFHHISAYGGKVASYTMHPRGWTTAMQATPSGK